MKKSQKNLLAILLTMFISFIMPISALGVDKLVVKDGDGTTTFKVEDDGSVAASGNVAIGTTSSSVPLLVQTADTGHVATFFRQDGAYYYMSVYGLGLNRLVFNYQGYLGIGTTTPSYPLEMASGAYVSSGGIWTNASSREYKTDIKQLTAEKAMDALTELKPVEFAYKADSQEKHIGFIAEDAPELVATKDKKGMSSMDVVAVLTKVVQEQQATIAELSKEMAELKKELGSR